PSSADKEATKVWVESKCKELGQSEFTCGSIYGVVIGHCQNRERAPEPDPTAEPEPTRKEKKK
ncbi:MAG: hypothetical protein AAB401_09760, partial [Acidobacteriota bacterium]